MRVARLHRGLQLLDDVALLDEVVLDLDAGDLRERLGQRLRLVHRASSMRLRDDVISFTPCAFSLRGRVDEPFHLGELLLLRERRGLELAGRSSFCAAASSARALLAPRGELRLQRDETSPGLMRLLHH